MQYVRLSLAVLGFSLSLMPAQAQPASRMALAAHADACTGLSQAECCVQLLELAGFRASSEQLPKSSKHSVRMSCGKPDKQVPENACRSILLMRGFGAKEVTELCKAPTLERRCRKSESCQACVSELGKLAFKGVHRACFAVTHVALAPETTKVIVVGDDKPGAQQGGGVVIRKRRTVVQ